MASSTLYLFLASLLIFIATSDAITEEQIKQICSKAISPKACLDLLHSTPGVPSSDMKNIGKIVLDISKTKASNTKSFISDLAAKATDSTLKQRYKACIEYYNDASSDISEAKQAWDVDDRATMNIRVSAAETEIVDCTDEFSSPPADPSDLPSRTTDLFNSLGVALVISNML